MKLKKLFSELVEGIIDAGFDQNSKEIQDKSIPKIKSGTDLFIISPKDTGKSTAIAIGVIQQLKKEFEEAPRAIIMVATKEKAFEMEEQIKLLGKHSNLRTFTVFDQGIIQFQKDTIYDGLDILIGTPKRINELVNISGIPLTKIKMFVVDDTDFFPPEQYASIYRIADNCEKSQFIISANKWIKRLEKVNERIMKSPLLIRGR